MSTLEVLVLARKLIAEVGWCKHTKREREIDGNKIIAYCPMGAMEYSRVDNQSFWRAHDIFKKCIGADVISEWNDAPTRTKEDVIQAFDEAIFIAENGVL